MTIVRFFDKSFIPEGKLTYSVISARYEGKWIFVRHRLRSTWEICGGHIEPGETPEEAAAREVMEDTGGFFSPRSPVLVIFLKLLKLPKK